MRPILQNFPKTMTILNFTENGQKPYRHSQRDVQRVYTAKPSSILTNPDIFSLSRFQTPHSINTAMPAIRAHCLRMTAWMLCALPFATLAEDAWNPSQTFILVASVTRWPPKAKLPAFEGEKRRDGDLVEQLKLTGVPPANIIFLKDSAATHAAMRDSLASLAARSGPESTLIFYFQGHGSRKLLCCYDTDPDDPDHTEFHAEEVYPILEKWKGARLFLIGDCCSSGSLGSVVREFEKRRPGVKVACIASATASNISTGHWTFTDSLIKVFAGDPMADLDRDGKITLAETNRFIHDRMKYEENQLAGSTVTPSFESDFVMHLARPGKKIVRSVPGPHQIGDVLEARDSEGKWYVSEILDWRPARAAYRIHFYGWDSKWDEWVDTSRLRPVVKPKLNIGQRYEVKWQDGHWYLATITKTVEDWFYFAHYESETGDDDEWVTPDRTRSPGPTTAKSKPQFAAVSPRDFAVGEIVAAEWRTEWYRAKVTAKFNGIYAVLYDDNTTAKLAMDDLVPVARPGEIHPGDRVLACRDGKPRMFPGKVEAVNDRTVKVRWEDATAPAPVALDQVAHIKP